MLAVDFRVYDTMEDVVHHWDVMSLLFPCLPKSYCEISVKCNNLAMSCFVFDLCCLRVTCS